MCTLVILRRPGHDWPLILAANRDEMAGRPWRKPARHWADRADVVGGLDVAGGGTWLARNDYGVVAAMLNRKDALGPAPGKRSRGELPLDALDHADAGAAAEALADLDPVAWRPFNMVVADNTSAWWLASRAGARAIAVERVPDGLSMITAQELNDTGSARVARYLPLFREAAAPDPDAGDWEEWAALMAGGGTGDDPSGAMSFATGSGFATLSGSLIALPSTERQDPRGVWLFAAARPGTVEYKPVED